jgi:hypothetical protein
MYIGDCGERAKDLGGAHLASVQGGIAPGIYYSLGLGFRHGVRWVVDLNLDEPNPHRQVEQQYQRQEAKVPQVLHP